MQEELLRQLAVLIDKYIDDPNKKKKLIDAICPEQIKYVLAEFEKHKNSQISPAERKLIKDIYFNYC